MRRKIVAGNWKMNGSSELVSLLTGAINEEAGSLDNGVEVVIIPPALYVSDVIRGAGKDIQVGVQNVARWESGAYTGEIAAAMAADIGCKYTLIGHSERRQLFGETDEQVAEKVTQALSAGLVAVVCVGETLEEREQGSAEAVVSEQVRAGLSGVSGDQWSQIVVAYEPVWAIGTGKTATADDAQAMHGAIREQLEALGAPAKNVSILYGGSVKADNAPALFAQPDIDGGLIGGASLKADEFVRICQAVPGESDS